MRYKSTGKCNLILTIVTCPYTMCASGNGEPAKYQPQSSHVFVCRAMQQTVHLSDTFFSQSQGSRKFPVLNLLS